MEGRTFHVAFALIDDERVASTPALLVAHYPDALNHAVALEFASQVALGRVFVLWGGELASWGAS